jgi:hypothetical protein
MVSFLRWGVVSTLPNHQAGTPPLVGCPLPFIQYIRNCSPRLEAVPPSAPCCGDSDPPVTDSATIMRMRPVRGRDLWEEETCENNETCERKRPVRIMRPVRGRDLWEEETCVNNETCERKRPVWIMRPVRGRDLWEEETAGPGVQTAQAPLRVQPAGTIRVLRIPLYKGNSFFYS